MSQVGIKTDNPAWIVELAVRAPPSDPLAFAKVRYAIRGGKVIASAATAASGK